MLTEYIVWEGRYPVPKRKERLEQLDDLLLEAAYREKDLGGLKVRGYNGALDWGELDKIWCKAHARFSELHDRWYGGPRGRDRPASDRGC